MTEYTKGELEQILENDFLLNSKVFEHGRTNDDVVDSVLICAALDRPWEEFFAKWLDNYTKKSGDGFEWIEHEPKFSPFSYYNPNKDYEVVRILAHYNRVKDWAERKGWFNEEWLDKTPERFRINAIMLYAINY